MKPWVHLKAVSYSEKRDHWTATIRTPGSRSSRRLRAKTFAEIVVLYLAHAFDKESLLAAAEMAETRETMMKRIRSIQYQTRKETDEPTQHP